VGLERAEEWPLTSGGKIRKTVLRERELLALWWFIGAWGSCTDRSP
jgi:hypothetical protein